MENQLDRNNRLPTTSTHSDGAKRIGMTLTEINKLVAFPLDGPQLMGWADDLDRLLTDDGREKLPFLMDCFKTGRLFYDKTEGIQNIFNNLKLIKKEGEKFIILKPVW